MASSSASSTHGPPSLASRLSSLKVFKFSNRDKDGRPPPPPPKDEYYLRNRSLASLVPDSLSLAPNSPMSPQHPFQYPAQPAQATQSTMSLVSSAASAVSSSPAEHKTRSQKDRALGFLTGKFGKRSPRSPSRAQTVDSAEAQQDDSISMPWNFQHNIHVDDGLVGLPPSWSTSLAAHGFSEEEIQRLHQARETRSPSTQLLFNRRPNSPSISHPYQPNPSTVPILTNPAPRTTSLPRQYSDASLRSGSHSNHPLPLSHHAPSASTSSLHSSKAGSISSQPRLVPQRHPKSQTHAPQLSISYSSDSTHSSREEVIVSSSTPPRMATYPSDVASSRSKTHTVNGSTSSSILSSSPPSNNLNGNYRNESNTLSNRLFGNHQQAPSLPQLQPQSFFRIRNKTEADSNAPSTSTNSNNIINTNNSPPKLPATGQPSSIQTKRAAGSAPRLSISLHNHNDSSDLSSWAGALFDGLASGDLDGQFAPGGGSSSNQQPTTPLSPPNSAAIPFANGRTNPPQMMPLTPRKSVDSDSSTPPILVNGEQSAHGRSTAATKSKPRPLSKLVEREDDGDELTIPWSSDIPTSSSPLWSQLEGILGQPVASRDANRGGGSEEGVQDEDERRPYSAALAETFSPTLPISPEEERMAAQRRMRMQSRSANRELLTSSSSSSTSKNESEQLDMDEQDDHRLSVNTMRPNRDSSRSSTSTIGALGVATTMIVRNVSIVRRAGAYVIAGSGRGDLSPAGVAAQPLSGLPTPPMTTSTGASTAGTGTVAATTTNAATNPEMHKYAFPPSPPSSQFGASEEGYPLGSTPSSSQSQDVPATPTSDLVNSPLAYYLQPSPDPSQVSFSPMSPSFGKPQLFQQPEQHQQEKSSWHLEDDEDEDEDGDESGTSLVVPSHLSAVTGRRSPNAASPSRPTIVISSDAPSPTVAPTLPSATPLSPFQRYRGWLSEVVAPLEEYIDETVDPRDHYLDLKEIAEGESGSVYSARLTPVDAHRLRLPAHIKARNQEDIAQGREILIAIKSVAIVPSGSPKLTDLRHELGLMRGLHQENLISLDALYVDLLEDTLWIRMELMERSLADVVALVEEGLMLQDRTMARFASDILKGLEYLQQHNIAHRDIRSDNLLLNKQGVLKITDFANAVQVPAHNPMRDDPAGVLYWQAPEIRSPPYNTLKVDVWSLGATVWEMAETQPPFADTNQFADRWPSVQHPEIHSPAFHEFLQLCSEPAMVRPSPTELLQSSFINNACGRPVIVHLLSQCIAIEAALA